MKTRLAASLLLTATLAQAQSTNTYSLSPNVGIADGSPLGVAEQFNVGLNGAISDIQVSLDITGGFNGDLYAYLAGPQGQLAVLLNRPGITGSNPYGYNDAGMNITLAMVAVNNIHDYATVGGYSLNGTTWLADGRNLNPQSLGSILYGAPTTANLSLFQNTEANGMWTFFIADLAPGGGTPTLNSVALTIMTAPEPQTWVMFGGGLAVFWLCRRWRMFRS